MKSNPFFLQRTVPYDVSEGDTFVDSEGKVAKITRIKKVRFMDLRTVQIIGLCVDV